MSFATPITPVQSPTRREQLEKQRKRRSAPASLSSKSSILLDLKSHASSTSLSVSQEQLRSLSQSPISKRLHISNLGESSKYVIPIPFTLQLPPKLSHRNIEKERSRSSSPVRAPEGQERESSPERGVRLVYTGTGYEKLDCEHENADLRLSDIDLLKLSLTLPTPPRPKKGYRNRGNMRGRLAHRIPSADELSVLEEMSNSQASSRHPSANLMNTHQNSLAPLLRRINSHASSVMSFNSVEEAVNYNESLREKALSREAIGSSLDRTMQPSPLYEFKDIPRGENDREDNILSSHEPEILGPYVPLPVGQLGEYRGYEEVPIDSIESPEHDFKRVSSVPNQQCQLEPAYQMQSMEQYQQSRSSPSNYIADSLTQSPAQPETRSPVHSSSSQNVHAQMIPSQKVVANKDKPLPEIVATGNSVSSDEENALVEAERAKREQAAAEEERLARIEQERLARIEQERIARMEQERLARIEQERLAQIEQERLARMEQERLAQIEQERLAKIEQERLARMEQERLAQEKKVAGQRELKTESFVHHLSPVESSRIVSNASENSLTSASSWDSIQRSVDISLADEESIRAPVAAKNKKIALEKLLPPTPQTNNDSDSDWVDEEDSLSFEKSQVDSFEVSQDPIAPLRISRASTIIQPREEHQSPKAQMPTKSVSQPLLTTPNTMLTAPQAPQPDSSFDASIEIPDYYFDECASVLTANYLEVTAISNLPKVNATAHNYRIVSESDNEGSGRRFSFPSSTTSKSYRPEPSLTSRPLTYSFFNNKGQIEIPNLDDESMNKNFMPTRKDSGFTEASNASSLDVDKRFISEDVSRYYAPSSDGHESSTLRHSRSKSTYDLECKSGAFDSDLELEPVGVPSKAAKNLFRETLKPFEDLDSDDSTTTYSGYTRLKSNPNLRPLSSSPIRHQRHKLMYSIDFDVGSIASSHPSSIQSSRFSAASPACPQPTPRPTMKQKLKSSYDIRSGPHISKPLPNKLRNLENPEKMDIVVANPPPKVDYAVDFKEATSQDEDTPFNNVAPSINEISKNGPSGFTAPDDRRVKELTRQLTDLKMLRYAEEQEEARSHGSTTATSHLSYKNSLSTKPESASSMSDSESVVIDLTKDSYDVCMVSRMNSVCSYRSVIEKANGKDVEVVLVDDEDTGSDLLSLYSKYRHNEYLFRSSSMYSGISDLQRSARSTRASRSGLNRSTGSVSLNMSSMSASYNSKRITPPAKRQEKPRPPYTTAKHVMSGVSSFMGDYYEH